MYIEPHFYQLTGYRAHSHKWFTHKKYDDKPLMEAILSTKSKLFRPGGPDSPIELVLGILPSGASYLLMSGEQMFEFTHKHRQKTPRDPWRADDFLSLSPIYFNSLSELSTKIATYKQRPRNKNRREHEETLDNSQANRGYVKTGTEVFHYRAYFEQQRILYRLLTRDLEAGKVGLVSPPWLGCLRIVSLVIEEWSVDNRRRDERLHEPRLVAIGWTDALLPSFFEKLAGSTVHFSLSKLRNPGSKTPYFSEIIGGNEEQLYMRVRDLFKHDANKSGIPLVVLVHDEDMARRFLSRAGVDVASWTSGLSKLLPITPVKVKNRIKSELDVDNLQPVLPECSIVDTQKLVKAMMEINPGKTVPESAKILRVQTDARTCAGDDSLLQLRIWTLMAQGFAIDEQHKERESRQPDCMALLAPPEGRQQQQQQADEEMDPNDMVAPPPQRAPIDDFSDDDW